MRYASHSEKLSPLIVMFFRQIKYILIAIFVEGPHDHPFLRKRFLKILLSQILIFSYRDGVQQTIQVCRPIEDSDQLVHLCSTISLLWALYQ